MVNNSLGTAFGLARIYVAVSLVTLALVAALSAVAPDQATGAAWTHAVIVAGFALLLPLRLRSARHGSSEGLAASKIIAGVILGVNIVEALLPGTFPVWMGVDMVAIAGIMLAMEVTLFRVGRV